MCVGGGVFGWMELRDDAERAAGADCESRVCSALIIMTDVRGELGEVCYRNQSLDTNRKHEVNSY